MVTRRVAQLERGQVLHRPSLQVRYTTVRLRHPDSVGVNHADYVITTRTLDASAPPTNWVLVRTTPHYELFARRGTAPAREILDEQSAPGATLECSQASARALAAKPGIAAVRPPPVSSSAWRNAAGATLPQVPGVSAVDVPPGQVAFSTLPAMPGPVELSLAYTTLALVTLRAGTVSVHLTPTIEPYGPLWDVAVISTHGRPLSLRLHVGRGRVQISNAGALVGLVSAVPARLRDTLVPLRAACGATSTGTGWPAERYQSYAGRSDTNVRIAASADSGGRTRSSTNAR